MDSAKPPTKRGALGDIAGDTGPSVIAPGTKIGNLRQRALVITTWLEGLCKEITQPEETGSGGFQKAANKIFSRSSHHSFAWHMI